MRAHCGSIAHAKHMQALRSHFIFAVARFACRGASAVAAGSHSAPRASPACRSPISPSSLPIHPPHFFSPFRGVRSDPFLYPDLYVDPSSFKRAGSQLLFALAILKLCEASWTHRRRVPPAPASGRHAVYAKGTWPPAPAQRRVVLHRVRAARRAGAKHVDLSMSHGQNAGRDQNGAHSRGPHSGRAMHFGIVGHTHTQTHTRFTLETQIWPIPASRISATLSAG